MRSQIQPVVVILAAGLGTRMKSARAKVLHKAGGKALIEHVVDTALALTTPERVFVVVGHQADAVRAVLESSGVGFILQSEQRGTGHALLCGQTQLQAIEGPLMILYGDCPLIAAKTLQRLLETQTSGDAAGVVLTANLEDPTGYGRVVRAEDGSVAAIVEQKAGTAEQLAIREINSGIYCFDPGAFWPALQQVQPNNAVREYYLTDVVELMRRAGRRMQALPVDDPAEVLGINNRIELAGIDRLLRERKARELMLSGVTIVRPEAAMIDVGVTVGADTILEAFVHLRGRTVIGSNCRIGACSVLEDSVLGDEVEILPFTLITSSRIEGGVRIGPFSRLRPANHVETGAHIGNFVELKNTHLGAGSKANHLAYLGDSDIGTNVNVGAGTITCNYDGRKKYRTTIGNRVFVGSNATLVAPVELGDDSYIAAGSVITDRVPKEALGVGRSRQTNKEHWVTKRRDTAG